MTDTAHSSASITARELSSWQPTQGSADNDLLPELDTIVSRSRDLARNHGVAAGAIRTLNDNIVGVGFRLSAKPDYKLLGKTKEWEEECVNQGLDWEEVLEQRLREKNKLQELGLYNEVNKSDDMGNNTRNVANHDRNSERNEEES